MNLDTTLGDHTLSRISSMPSIKMALKLMLEVAYLDFLMQRHPR